MSLIPSHNSITSKINSIVNSQGITFEQAAKVYELRLIHEKNETLEKILKKL